MIIINASEIQAFEKEKARCNKIECFSSPYLALGYMMLIGFICLVGGSLIKLVELLKCCI